MSRLDSKSIDTNFEKNTKDAVPEAISIVIATKNRTKNDLSFHLLVFSFDWHTQIHTNTCWIVFSGFILNLDFSEFGYRGFRNKYYPNIENSERQLILMYSLEQAMFMRKFPEWLLSFIVKICNLITFHKFMNK